jgi:hypothetical protein
MKTVVNVIAPLLATVIASAFGGCTEGCYQQASATPGDAYTAELSGCVAKAKTALEANVCRANVDRKYGLCETPSNPYPCL